MFASAQVTSSMPQVTRSETALGVGGDPRHDPAHRRAAVVGQRQILQVVEQLLAQVVAHTLAQHARQVDETKNQGSLDEDQQQVGFNDIEQRLQVLSDDAFIDDLLAQVGEIAVQEGDQDDGEQESDHPLPVRAGLGQDAQDGFTVETGVEFFFFEIFVGHGCILRSVSPSRVSNGLPSGQPGSS